MSNKLSSFFEAHYATCSMKYATGIDCPGCGMQRSLHALLEGNILSSIYYFPALIPLMIMFAYLFLHLFFKFENGAKALIIIFSINAFIILTNFLIKLLPLFI